MERTTLLRDPEVSVVNARLIVSGAPYDLGGIHSADLRRVPEAATGPIVMMVAGLICLFSVLGEAGPIGAALGAGLIVGAGVWWKQKKPTFEVYLQTSTGEATAFESREEEVAVRVLTAIREALAPLNVDVMRREPK